MPNAEREVIEQTDEVFKYLQQSRISEKNLSRLRQLMTSSDTNIARYAGIVLAVGEAAPHKRRRLRHLARERRDLLHELEDTGLIMAHS